MENSRREFTASHPGSLLSLMEGNLLDLQWRWWSLLRSCTSSAGEISMPRVEGFGFSCNPLVDSSMTRWDGVQDLTLAPSLADNNLIRWCVLQNLLSEPLDIKYILVDLKELGCFAVTTQKSGFLFFRSCRFLSFGTIEAWNTKEFYRASEVGHRWTSFQISELSGS